jgi:hypothetical protein
MSAVVYSHSGCFAKRLVRFGLTFFTAQGVAKMARKASPAIASDQGDLQRDAWVLGIVKSVTPERRAAFAEQWQLRSQITSQQALDSFDKLLSVGQLRPNGHGRSSGAPSHV